MQHAYSSLGYTEIKNSVPFYLNDASIVMPNEVEYIQWGRIRWWLCGTLWCVISWRIVRKGDAVCDIDDIWSSSKCEDFGCKNVGEVIEFHQCKGKDANHRCSETAENDTDPDVRYFAHQENDISRRTCKLKSWMCLYIIFV